MKHIPIFIQPGPTNVEMLEILKRYEPNIATSTHEAADVVAMREYEDDEICGVAETCDANAIVGWTKNGALVLRCGNRHLKYGTGFKGVC